MNSIPLRPTLPPNMVLKEADMNSGEYCPICSSSIKKSFGFFGQTLGCYQQQCPNFWENNKNKNEI